MQTLGEKAERIVKGRRNRKQRCLERASNHDHILLQDLEHRHVSSAKSNPMKLLEKGGEESGYLFVPPVVDA